MLEFDLARNALRYLINNYNIKEIYIPYYLCNVVRNTIFKENCKPKFYHIDDNFLPSIDFPKESFILYPNYFGICDNNVKKLVTQYPNIIIDNAHSYYATPSGFASFTAGHKWENNLSSNLYIGNEEINITIDFSRRKNFNQYHQIYSTSNLLKIDINEDSIPFCYPYLASRDAEADNLANSLKQQGKIIYRYWDALPTSYNEYTFYRRLVPIPLD